VTTSVHVRHKVDTFPAKPDPVQARYSYYAARVVHRWAHSSPDGVPTTRGSIVVAGSGHRTSTRAPAREHGHPDIEAVRSCTVCPPGAATAPRSSRTIAPHSVKGLTVEHTDRTHRLHTSAPFRRTGDLRPAAPYRPGGPCRHRRDRCPLRQRGLLPARRTLRPLGGA